MSTNPLSKLEFTHRTAKRAQYEAFEYTLVPTGILIRNGSHAKPEEHEYVVTVEKGIPTACECPADEHYDGACKHRVAVAIRRPILRAITQQQLATDGGTLVNTPEGNDHLGLQTDSGNATATQDCSCLDSPASFPCWECIRTGCRSIEECK